MIEQATEALQSLIGSEGNSGAIFAKLIETFLSLILLGLLQQAVYYLINRNIDKIERRHQLRVWTRNLALLLVLSILVSLWLPSGQMILQAMALLAAALAVTLGRPISSVLAWLVIVIDHPFGIGDRIEAGDVKGDVIDIGLLHIHLLEVGNWVDADQTTGRIIHLPNRTIFEGPVFNSTAEFDLIWNELEFVLTHDSDWERGRELILAQAQPIYERIEEHAMEAADRMTQRYAYQRGITTPYVYVKLLRDGIKLSLRYLCETRRRRGTTHDITVGFLSAIRSEPTIKLAAPTVSILLPEENHRTATKAHP